MGPAGMVGTRPLAGTILVLALASFTDPARTRGGTRRSEGIYDGAAPRANEERGRRSGTAFTLNGSEMVSISAGNSHVFLEDLLYPVLIRACIFGRWKDIDYSRWLQWSRFLSGFRHQASYVSLCAPSAPSLGPLLSSINLIFHASVGVVESSTPHDPCFPTDYGGLHFLFNHGSPCVPASEMPECTKGTQP